MKFSTRVNSKAQTEFWTRMFKLESKVEWAISQLKGPRVRITMPIIAEFVVDPELKWVYCIIFLIDPLGINQGFGYVYCCDSDPEDQKAVYERRDKFADEIISTLEKGPGIDEAFVIPEGQEYEKTDLPLPQQARVPSAPEGPPDTGV